MEKKTEAENQLHCLKEATSCSEKTFCFFCRYLTKKNSENIDLQIFRKVGSATYTQLCENFPSYYNEKYCEYRNGGDTLSHIPSLFSFFMSKDQFVYKKGCCDISSKRNGLAFPSPSSSFSFDENCYSFDDAVPFPPNYVSSLISELPYKKPCEIKFFLIKGLLLSNDENYNIFKEFLEGSSKCYNFPVYKYGDIFFLTLFVTFVVCFLYKKLI